MALRRTSGLGVERGEALGRRRSAPVIGREAGDPNGLLHLVPRLGRTLRLLVDALDLGRDGRPGVALSTLARGRAHAQAGLGLQVEGLKLLGEPLRVRGRHQDSVDSVGDDVGVARDLRRDHRGAGREGLRQHHPEALTGERGRAEHVRLV